MKRIIMIIVLLISLVIPSISFAGMSCDDFEYAELMDMDKDTLIKEYCKVQEYTLLNLKLALFGGRIHQRDFDNCSKISSRMQRILLKRFPEETLDSLTKDCSPLK